MKLFICGDVCVKDLAYPHFAANDAVGAFSDVLDAFEDVKKVTHCSTGCGGCHNKVLDVISEILMGPEKV